MLVGKKKGVTNGTFGIGADYIRNSARWSNRDWDAHISFELTHHHRCHNCIYRNYGKAKL